jgi:hypothetical protein
MPPTNAEHIARNSWNELRRRAFHRRHASEARDALARIERTLGKTNPAELRAADAYAREVLGDACYAPWLRVYTALNGTFIAGWIPDNYYGWIVVPRLKGHYGKVSDLKTLARVIFRDTAFPAAGYHVNGLFYSQEYRAVTPLLFEKTLFNDTDKIVFKSDQSGQGRSVLILRQQDFSLDLIKSLGNGVFQRFIRQHEVFSQFGSAAVATIRFTTVIDDQGSASLRACFLRLGRDADSHVRPATEICVSANLLDGCLQSTGYQSDWTYMQTHPDSKVAFVGTRLPAFQQCVAKVLELHGKFPFARCVGWDVTVDVDENVVVLEWNAEYNDVKFSEATQGPCFLGLGWEKLGQADYEVRGPSQQRGAKTIFG